MLFSDVSMSTENTWSPSQMGNNEAKLGQRFEKMSTDGLEGNTADSGRVRDSGVATTTK